MTTSTVGAMALIHAMELLLLHRCTNVTAMKKANDI